MFDLLTFTHYLLVVLSPFVFYVYSQHCVGPGEDGQGCDESFNPARKDKIPKNWKMKLKVTDVMVPHLPGLVGAPLCRSCANRLLAGKTKPQPSTNANGECSALSLY